MEKIRYDQYARVILKDGQTATIVEVLGDHAAYIVDIDLENDWETESVSHAEIARQTTN